MLFSVRMSFTFIKIICFDFLSSAVYDTICLQIPKCTSNVYTFAKCIIVWWNKFVVKDDLTEESGNAVSDIEVEDNFW